MSSAFPHAARQPQARGKEEDTGRQKAMDLQGGINPAAAQDGGVNPRPTQGCHPFFSTLLPSNSAICTAFNAAPLRRLSLTIHIDRPFSMVLSSRMRLT